MNSNKVIFLHISKTAGTTLREIATKAYDENNVTEVYGSEEEKKVKFDNALDKGGELIFGHFDFSFIPDSVEGYQIITFLRNPLDQVVSHYLHFAQKNKWELDDENFLSFLESYEGQNWQCQYLAGWRREKKALADKEALFQKAISNLNERVDFCGITERFDDSLLWLESKLGWIKVAYKKRNMAQQPGAAQQIQQKFKSEILEANGFDQRLYELALKMFEKKIKEVDFMGWKRFLRRFT